jgi:PAS domain S-box-containing protein
LPTKTAEPYGEVVEVMEDPFKQYFDRMPCYLTVQDRDFRILQANERFRRDFGDFEDRFCYQVYKHRSEKCEVCPVEEAFWDGQCHRREEQVKCLDGREVSVLVEATPVFDTDGRITSVIEMSTDVTHIMRLEEQLRRSQQRYRLLFEEVPCYISIQGPDLRMIEMNRAFREDFGSSLGALGCKCYEVYKHRTEECLPCPVRDTFEDGQIHTREEVVTSLQDELINVLVTTAPIRDGNGQIVAVMEMSTNITELRRLESHLTSLGLLIGSVSHALKGLLNGLAGGMYLVETGFAKDKPDRVRQGWEIVKRNVARIRSTVSDILYYAKDREPVWETLSAAELAEEVCGLMQPRAGELGARLTSELDPTAGRFEGDPRALRALLVNLLENSLDACRLDPKKPDHEVTLRLDGSADRVRFEVRDNGVGMDQETRDKAFSLFFSSKGTEGTGLGLFIANRIALAHGGTIELESQAGVGTQFVVELPRSRPPQGPAQAPPGTKEASDG